MLDEHPCQHGAVKRFSAPLREPSVAAGGREQAAADCMLRFGSVGEVRGTKSRLAGFHEYQPTLRSFLDLFAQLRRNRIIPA
jgi:hypothetical protein